MSLNTSRSSRSRSHSNGRSNLDTSIKGFTPRTIENLKNHLLPPVLPANSYPTIPPVDKPTRSKPLSCPYQWIDRQSTQPWIETIDFKTLIDKQSNEEICKKFIENNRYTMWRYDYKYKEMTPREIKDDLLSNHNFQGIMRLYQQKERTFNLGSSVNISQTLQHHNKFNENDSTFTDPYISTLTTSRDQRSERLQQLFKQSNANYSTKYNRGYNHEIEYGNFSKFCALLKQNEGATMKR
eukprot:gene18661-24407_t